MREILTAQECKELPVGSLVLARKDEFVMGRLFRIVELHGLKCFCGVYSRQILTIKPRPKKKIWYERYK